MFTKKAIGAFVLIAAMLVTSIALAGKPPNTKSKFYDFNEQLIDGQIRKPTALYINTRERAKFNRLLRLKKSFLNKLFQTSKERVFK